MWPSPPNLTRAQWLQRGLPRVVTEGHQWRIPGYATIDKVRRRVLALPPEQQNAPMERPDLRLYLLRWGCAHSRAAAKQSRRGHRTPPSKPPSPPHQPPSAELCVAFSVGLHLEAPPLPTCLLYTSPSPRD
eukprot:14916456-Alexandrium_andersonii.AAC.1